MRGQERDCSECKSAQDLPMFVLSVCHQAAEFCKCPVTGRALIRIAVSTRISISICNHQPLKLLHMLVLAHKVLDRFLSFFLPAAVPWPKTGRELVLLATKKIKTNGLGAYIGVHSWGNARVI